MSPFPQILKPKYLSNQQNRFFFAIVRLVGWGNVTSKGRVEVFTDGAWRGVCGNRWDLNDANVVCRQLGFKGAITSVTSSDRYRSRLIHDVTCKGNERFLKECDHIVSTRYCTNNRDAGAVCITGIVK